MGGLGHHPAHPYGVQVAALLWSMLLPGSLFVLALGAWWERARRSGSRLRLTSTHRMRATKRFIRATRNDNAAA